MPYADRVDRAKTRTINFYCHMAKSANRKLVSDGFQGCNFRMMYKLKSPMLLTMEDDIFVLFKVHEMHNH